MARYIGVRYRTKWTKEGEARPTEIAIVEGDTTTSHELADEDAELDFVRGVYPVKHRKVTDEDDVRTLPAHHVKWKAVKEPEAVAALPEQHVRRVGKEVFVATQVPAAYEGVHTGDTIAMVLGGAGDRFAFALSRHAETLDGNTRIVRIPPSVFARHRDTPHHRKEDDAVLLATLALTYRILFTEVTPRDRLLIRLTEVYRAMIEVMKSRIACEQRLRQHLIGQIFCSEEGGYPEGSIEQGFERHKANDVILLALTNEENKRRRELTKAVEELDVYAQLFKPITGVGPLIATRLIVAIGDIRRFDSAPKLKAFCGVHMVEGQFARRRQGAVANWHPEARQALYLLTDQFNRRPDSEWGKRLRTIKAEFRRRHPVVECSTCEMPWEQCVDQKKHTRRYTDAHIHKMALWRTATKFAEWLWREWRKVEDDAAKAEAA